MKKGYRRNFRQEPMEAMKVVVHNNDVTKALRTLKKKLKKLKKMLNSQMFWQIPIKYYKI